MTNLFNINIDRIIHDGADVTLIMLDGTVVYENLGYSLTYTVHNDMDGIIGDPLGTADIPQFWDWDDDYSLTSPNKGIFVTKLDGSIVSITGNKYVYNSDIAKVRISYSEGIDNIRFQNMDFVKTVEYVNISNLTSFKLMFKGCVYIESINMKDWDTSNITDMNEMFWDCAYLTELDLSHFNTSNVTNMADMFWNCHSLTTLRLDNFDTSNVTNTNGMLAGCDSLTTLRLDNCTNDTISKILNSEEFPTGTIPNETRTIYCKKEYIEQNDPPDGWNFVSVNGEPVFPEPPAVRPLFVVGQFENDATITTVDVLVDSSHNDLNDMFQYCESLTSVNTEGWDTSNVTNMKRMFYNCRKLTELDVSNFDTSKVTDMSYMFQYCELLTSLDVSGWDVGNVWTMDYMFSYCELLTSLDCNGWDVSNVTNLLNTFNSCTNLVDLKAPKNINANMNVRYSTALSHDSLMSIINNLATVTSTRTLTLGSTNLAKLTSSEIAIATNKGWTVQ